MEYNWNFSPLECYPEKDNKSNVVFLVHWQYTGKEIVDGKEYSDTVIGTQALPLPQDSFVPYEELTKEMVQFWIETEKGESRIADMKETIRKNIQEQINPTKVVMLNPPWV